MEVKKSRLEINNKLAEIRSRIGKDDSSILKAEMDELFKYKPVSSLFYAVQAKILLYDNNITEANQILSGKEDLWYPSEEALEIIDCYIKMFEMVDNDFQRDSFSVWGNYVAKNIGKRNAYEAVYLKYMDSIKYLESNLNNGIEDAKQIDQLINSNCIIKRIVEAAILVSTYSKDYELSYSIEKFISEYIAMEGNLAFLVDQLSVNKDNPFVLIVHNAEELEKYRMYARMLSKANHKVILIESMITLEIENEIDLRDTVNISIDNLEDKDGYSIIHPIEIIYRGECIGDNLTFLIDKLVKDTPNEYMNVISSIQMLNALQTIELFEGRTQCLMMDRAIYNDEFWGFGYVGKYTSYISQIYGNNYESEINMPNEYKFSIIIPVRNNAYTLKYTLETCLEQRGISEDDYEIIISDNSDPENENVLECVNSFSDKRIKYYHTPRSLLLHRSFEFAYSKARGSFIIPLGADDALLPWGLETIEKCLEEYPEEQVVAWERGYFVWSDSKQWNAGQFVIPNYYEKGRYDFEVKKTKEVLINRILTIAGDMYGMPLLYINSGFRREYLKKIIQYTGKVMDGFTQDLNMGIINLVINDTYVNMSYPITIAAISDASLGAKAIKTTQTHKEQSKIQKDVLSTIGMGTPMRSVYNFIPLHSDTAMFFAELFRILDITYCRNIILKIFEKVNWRECFETIFMKLSISNVDYIPHVSRLRSNAYLVDDTLGKWFDDTLLKAINEWGYCKSEKKNIEEKTFEQGFIRSELLLDARKFDVDNVKQATELFCKITNL